VLMDLQPYADIILRASKSFGSMVTIDASFTSRQFVSDGVETTYNHEFKRVEGAPSLRDWPLQGLVLRVIGDYWNSSADDFWTLGGDLSLKLHRDVTLSFGTAYALYSIDAFTGEEHDRVRTYSAGLRWQVDSKSWIDARFVLEYNDIDNFRILD